MTRRNLLILLLPIAALVLSGCTVNFVGKTPVSPKVQFITGNQALDPTQYEVLGIVVVQRQNTFFDFFGLIKPMNVALEEVFTDDIANELTDKVLELGGNAVLNMEIINFSVLPGGFLYFLPIGFSTVTMQATAIDLKK